MMHLASTIYIAYAWAIGAQGLVVHSRKEVDGAWNINKRAETDESWKISQYIQSTP